MQQPPTQHSEVGPSSADQFLQQALGNNSGDSRLVGGLLTATLLLAVVAWWVRRSKSRYDQLPDGPDLEEVEAQAPSSEG